MPDSPGVTIVARNAWGARSPKNPLRSITVPTAELWLHHFAGRWHGASGMRACQNFHMDTNGWNDIAYSFCVDTDGVIYEGRGAGIAGGHTKGHNTISHAICLMGNFDVDELPRAMVRAVAALAAHGQSHGWWGDWTGGHREASGASTACPGKHGMAALPDIRALTAQYRGQPTQEDDTLYLFRSAEEARPFVVNAYKRIAGRAPESEHARETWVYSVVTSPKSALDLLTALQVEANSRRDNLHNAQQKQIDELMGRPYNGDPVLTEKQMLEAVAKKLLAG